MKGAWAKFYSQRYLLLRKCVLWSMQGIKDLLINQNLLYTTRLACSRWKIIAISRSSDEKHLSILYKLPRGYITLYDICTHRMHYMLVDISYFFKIIKILYWLTQFNNIISRQLNNQTKKMRNSATKIFDKWLITAIKTFQKQLSLLSVQWIKSITCTRHLKIKTHLSANILLNPQVPMKLIICINKITLSIQRTNRNFTINQRPKGKLFLTHKNQ